MSENPPCQECGYDGLFNTTNIGAECPECGDVANR